MDWVRLNPATVAPGLVGLTAGGPHPNAGLLFVEFMTSKEGQQNLPEGELPAGAPRRAAARIPDTDPGDGGFAATVLTPAITQRKSDHWDAVVAQVHVKRLLVGCISVPYRARA